MVWKRKKRPQDEGPKGAPEWVVTFTDMISLLVTFFVLLMTFSSMRKRDLLKIDSILEGSTSILRETDGPVVQETLEVDQIAATNIRRGALQPHSRPRAELLDNIDEMGQKLTEDHIAVDFSQHLDGLVIEFDEEAAFEPGSTRISAELERSLRELGDVLEHYAYMVVVEGAADAGFRPTAEHPTAESISCARASAAASVLLAGSELAPQMVQVAGLGASEPRADDATPEGRRKNRRVRVRVLSPSRTRAAHIASLERAEGAGR